MEKEELEKWCGDSDVRRNLLTVEGYRPYCGAMCRIMPRAHFNGEQFVCTCCGWESSFPADFIKKYKETWGIKDYFILK